MIFKKKQKFPIWESQVHNNVIVLCSKWRTVSWVPDASLWLETSFSTAPMFSRWCGSCVYCRCRTFSLRNPLRQSHHSSRFTTERDYCVILRLYLYLYCHYLKLLQLFSIVTLIMSQKCYQNFVHISKNHPYFHVIKNSLCKLPDWILRYGKLRFPVTNFRIFESRKLLRQFCWELQNLFHRIAS